MANLRHACQKWYMEPSLRACEAITRCSAGLHVPKDMERGSQRLLPRGVKLSARMAGSGFPPFPPKWASSVAPAFQPATPMVHGPECLASLGATEEQQQQQGTGATGQSPQCLPRQ
uniref:Uncharacterized protein n=1 Tax=Micrurus corallinus TaxID=54390 RepID=A0A2D4ERR1_MICCO